MAAVLGRDKLDNRIRADFGRQERTKRNEGIILRGDQEHGNADLSGDAFRAHMIVIVLGIAIAELRRGDDVVELTDRANRWQTSDGVALRQHLVFSRIARHQTLPEAPLVKIVVRTLERIGASGEIKSRTHGADSTQSLRDGRAELSSHLGHQVSTHRATSKKELRETVNI